MSKGTRYREEKKLEKKKMKETRKRFIRLLPIIVVSAIVPLIMHYAEHETRLTDFVWYMKDQVIDSELHQYYRTIVFGIVVLFMVLILICDGVRLHKAENKRGREARAFMEKWRASVKFIPLAVYLLFMLLSSLVSEYSDFSFSFAADMFETVWVVIGYGVCAYYTFFFAQEEKQVRIILTGVAASATALGLLGVLQMLGLVSFGSGILRYLIYPWDGELVANDFWTDRIAGASEMTFGNSNIAGGYLVIMLPVIIMLFVDGIISRKSLSAVKEEKDSVADSGKAGGLLRMVWYFLLVLILLAALYGSKSSSGMIGFAVAVVLGIIFLRKKIFRKTWMIPVVLVLVAGGIIGANYVTGNVLVEKLRSAFSKDAQVYALEDIETNDDNITISYRGEEFVFKAFPNEDFTSCRIEVTDGNGNPIAHHRNEENPTVEVVDDARFPGFQYYAFNTGEYRGFSIVVDQKPWSFTIGEDGTYYYYNAVLRQDKIGHPKTAAVFDGRERMFTHRGYIWGRTLPLVKDYLFLGSGANTFFAVFPQNDYIMINQMGDTNKYIDKAHSLYLQQFIQAGGIAAVAFIVFFICYFIDSFRIYWKSGFETYLERIGLGIMLGIAGYLVYGLANDSVAVLAPVFWCVTGLGFGVNYLVRRER